MRYLADSTVFVIGIALSFFFAKLVHGEIEGSHGRAHFGVFVIGGLLMILLVLAGLQFCLDRFLARRRRQRRSGGESND